MGVFGFFKRQANLAINVASRAAEETGKGVVGVTTGAVGVAGDVAGGAVGVAGDVAGGAVGVAGDVVGAAGSVSGAAASAAAQEAVRAANELAKATRTADHALRQVANAAIVFTTQDVVRAAGSAVTWTGNAAGDAGEWVVNASVGTQRAVFKAANFVDRTAEDAGRGIIHAAEAVDDILQDLADPLPDSFAISVGPFEITNQGVAIKPKFELGFELGGLDISLGIEDIRDGLNVGISIDHEVFSYSTEGDDLQEILGRFELKIAGVATFPKQVGPVSIAFLSEPVLPRMVLETLGLNLHGFGTVRFKCKYITGAAIRGKISLGALFPDSHGYHMFGAGGEVSLGVKVVFELFMGFKKAEGSSLRSTGGFKVNLALPPGVVFEIEWLDADSKGQQSLNGLHGDMVEECVKTLSGFLSGRPYIPLVGQLI